MSLPEIGRETLLAVLVEVLCSVLQVPLVQYSHLGSQRWALQAQ
jgi:hypothetical protein